MKYTLLLTIIALASAALASPQGAKPLNAEGKSTLRVVAAQRAKEFNSYPQSLTPKDRATDVVLVLDLKGIPLKEFQSAKSENNYVMAGKRQCNPSIIRSGEVNGEEQLRLVFIVPKDILDMQLFFDGHSPVSFKAEEKINKELD
jgi:hypothetical protein